ncbi:enolase-phosphatase E1-like [Chironomus tepperi]|uniref:enolase-phosphatase E1-like n=1 Tax=Chironomus tepperi TaxID=113505 RepID=UPI00391EF2D2
MRHLVSFIVVILCCYSVQSHPLPDVIQYSVPSKFFNQNGSKASSFYDILKQIHFGGSSGSASTVTEQSTLSSSLDHVTTTISNEMVDIKNDESTMTPMEMDITNSNESPEAPVVTDDVTDEESKEHHQHDIDTTMKDNSSDNDESFTALIEKVVSEQIEKLASEFDTEIKINLSNEQNEVIEKSDLVHESNAMSNTEKAQLDNDKDDHDDDDDRVSETTMAINSEMDVVEDEKKEDEIVTTTSGMSIIESVDLDTENESTVVPTNPPEQTTNMETILADNVHEENKDDTESNDETFTEVENATERIEVQYNEIPGALLNALGDLLSSVLGVSETSIKNGLFIPTADKTTTTADDIVDENIHTEGSATTESDIVEHSTEQDLSSSTSALEFNENNEEEEIKTEATDVQSNESEIDTSVVTMPQESDAGTIANEIDLKIENLGNVHDTNFMTENTPEVFTETVKEPEMPSEMPSSDDIKNEITILEAMPAMTVDEELVKPVSFEESVNHIMNLVKDTEDRMELENAQNVLNSVLIEHNAVNENVNNILKSALKEIETNFGMNESEIEKEIQIPTDALETLDREREEMIKNFETDINESLIDSSIDQEDIYEPNMAKAALFHKFQYDDDF